MASTKVHNKEHKNNYLYVVYSTRELAPAMPHAETGAREAYRGVLQNIMQIEWSTVQYLYEHQ